MTFHPSPDRQRALVHYRQLAPEYDASCQYIEGISQDAVDSLRIQPGETVFDIACGTGTTLLAVARQVGQDGRAVGVELVPEMAAIASRKLQAADVDDHATVYIGAAEDFVTDLRADAILLCYTHDVLQSPAAIDNMLRHAKPGCRIAVVGWRWVPWWWGFGVNGFNAWRARKYLTTYKGLNDPTRFLASRLLHFTIDEQYYLGSSYRASGTVRGEAPSGMQPMGSERNCFT